MIKNNTAYFLLYPLIDHYTLIIHYYKNFVESDLNNMGVEVHKMIH